MKQLTFALVVAAVIAVGGVPATAVPPALNGHNCAGFTSYYAEPGFATNAIVPLVHLFPSALPTGLDEANCTDNGNGR